MTSREPDARPCPQCGNSNYGAGLTCMFCDAPLAVAADRHASPHATQFCTGCGTQINPGAHFCRKCGRNQRSDTASASVSRNGASKGQRTLRSTLSVLLAVGSIVVTYFLSVRVLGPMLGDRFGDATQTIVFIGVSIAVGSVARPIAKFWQRDAK